MKKRVLCVLFSMAMSAVLLSGCADSDDTTADSVNTPEDTSVSDDTVSDDTKTEQDTEPDTEPDDAEDQEEDVRKIALAMPTQSDQRWVNDAENMKKALEAEGYSVEVQYAQDDARQQAAQMEQFVADDADCIVIAAVDSSELTEAAAAAKEAQIPVIAYDRLLMDTDAVYYYTTFGQKGVGTLIGQTIIEKARLDDLADDAYKTIEFFMGDPDDSDAKLLYTGLMEALQPYLDSGKLVCNTGRTSFEDTSIADCSAENAQERCKNALAGYYTEEELDICAAAFDSLAYGCRSALQSAGYIADNWPVISGQNCEITACQNILDGTQTFSIYKDTRILAQACVAMIQAVLSDTEPEINDMEQYDNHVLTVPAYLCTPAAVDLDNLQEMLIDSGYYTEDQIQTAE